VKLCEGCKSGVRPGAKRRVRQNALKKDGQEGKTPKGKNGDRSWGVGREDRKGAEGVKKEKKKSEKGSGGQAGQERGGGVTLQGVGGKQIESRSEKVLRLEDSKVGRTNYGLSESKKKNLGRGTIKNKKTVREEGSAKNYKVSSKENWRV